ncbi:hypothetical protein H072_6503 [Dactylellina haptotyla CBS 200.50]|uniref:Peptidase C14 caspase domain-containing protein n=1 Tax=Dactylellina haptotyla (strain CBS 200.50) TaxID=1284197 RepID=S8BK44_DACHA|nr:hypothetical protein H072_6503 [Dactylellina haptotyla CBS 200.50]
MKLSIIPVVAFLLATTAGVMSAPLDVDEIIAINQLDARQVTIQTITVYSNKNFGGVRETVDVPLNTCHKLRKGIRDNVESADGFGNNRCTFFRQSDCQGANDSNDEETLAGSDGSFTKFVRPYIKNLRILVRNHARIDTYIPGTQRKVNFHNLKGCVRDVRAIETHLQGLKFHHVKILSASGESAAGIPLESKSELPIFENIVRELIYITNNASEGDLVYIHYSGHGIRRDKIEPDDENGDYVSGAALVLADVMDGGPYLTGFQLGRFMQNMVEVKNLRVNLVLDSCFSGRGVRSSTPAIGEYISRGGNYDFDDEKLPCDLTADDLIDRLFPSEYRDVRVKRSWLSNPTGCSILTACQFDETAAEQNFDGEYHGVLTYWILTLLKTPKIYRPSFARLREYAEANIKRMNGSRTQSPVLHGDGEYMFLGIDSVIERPLGRVLSRDNYEVVLDVGWAQGVSVGAVYDVYPKDQVNVPDWVPKIHAKVADSPENSAFRSTAELIFDQRDQDSVLEIEKGGAIVLRDWALPSKTLVAVSFPEGHHAEAEQRMNDLKLTLEKTVGLIFQSTGATGKTAFVIVIKRHDIEIYEGGKRIPRLPKIPTNDKDWIVKVSYLLNHVARFRALNEIKNDMIDLEDSLDRNWVTFQVARTDYKGGIVKSGSGKKLQVQEHTELEFTFTLSDKSPLDHVYLGVYAFSPSWSVQKVHPGPGQPLIKVRRGTTETFWLQPEIPLASTADDPEIVEDTVKAFVCTSQETWEEIELPDLPVNAFFNPTKHLIHGTEAFEDLEEKDRNARVISREEHTDDSPKWLILDITVETSPEI